MNPARPSLDSVLGSYKTLKAALRTLSDNLEDSREARVFEIEPHKDPAGSPSRSGGGVQDCIESKTATGSEEDGSSLAPLWDQSITVTPVAGKTAERLVRGAIKKIVRQINQPPTRPDRLPGVIWAPYARVTSAVQAANAAKQAFERMVREYSRPLRHHKERAEAFLGTDLEHVFLLKAYRLVPLITDRIEGLGFSWSGASRSVRRLTVREASEWVASLNQFGNVSEWTRRVATIDGEYVARVRRLAPFPVANIRRNGHWPGDHDAPTMRGGRIMANLPIVLTGAEWPEISDLTDYNPDKHKTSKKRDDSLLRPEPLIEELGLYEYRH